MGLAPHPYGYCGLGMQSCDSPSSPAVWEEVTPHLKDAQEMTPRLKDAQEMTPHLKDAHQHMSWSFRRFA